jgi:diguanylate cyclase (GGDEF)-like protein
MGRPLQLLIVEDSEDDAMLLLSSLRRAGFEPTWHRVDTERGMIKALESRSWDLIISDHSMPSFSAPAALKIVSDRGLDLPFIIVSGSIGEEAAVSAMKLGAQDYLAKGHIKRLPVAIERELKEADERRARRSAEERIRFLAYFDSLTSLPNRASFCEQVDALISDPKRSGAELALINVKIDNLREINNTLGHATGEQALLEIATRLQVALPSSNLLARVGGDDFAVALPDGGVGEALRIADEIQSILSSAIGVDPVEVEAVTSIGIALYPHHGATPELLLQRTNAALAQAIEHPARVAIYDRDRDPYQPVRLSMIAELRRAIETDQLRLHYQPKVDFSTGIVSGFEALVRWTHPKHGPVSPEVFVPLAEQSGLINPLTRWVLREALRQAGTWQRDGIDAAIAVNLSAKNLQNDDLAEQLDRLLIESDVPPDRLVLEVTESAIMTDHTRAREILEQLHARGVEIAIDDFGTGYSSFANLRRLPVSEIKIDKSFVQSMGSCPEDRVIVDSVIGLGHKLGLNVVAEGVENQAAWQTLANLRCDIAQGYFLSRPLPADKLTDWTRNFVAPPSLYPAPLRTDQITRG